MKLPVAESLGRKGIKGRPKRELASKAKSLSKLKRELDALFSEWNRRRFADKEGMVKSYTGTEIKHWKKMHNGHYITRSCLILRWNPNNARPQSPAENIWKHGNPIEFRENLVKEIGEDEVLFLEKTRHTLIRPTREFYESRIRHFKDAIASL